MNMGIDSYVGVATALFSIGVLGVLLNRRRVLVTLVSIELMFLAASLNFTAFSHFFKDLSGQIFSFFILATAAGGAAMGLGIIVMHVQNNVKIDNGKTERDG
jgi:NADH-quinone oxidoreductase subunit K